MAKLCLAAMSLGIPALSGSQQGHLQALMDEMNLLIYQSIFMMPHNLLNQMSSISLLESDK